MRRSRILNRIIPITVIGVVTGILLYMLRTEYLLGQLRYFDMDELFYLSLSRHVSLGYVPYRDFFFASPPGYLWFLIPLFIFKTGAGALLLARGLSFAVFLSLMAVTGVLYYILRRSWTVVFIPFFLAFLPIPSDKFLEIRPDTISLVFALGGTALQLFWMQHLEKKKGFRWSTPFIIGLLYALSLFLFPKTVIHIGIALMGLMIFLLVLRRKHILTHTQVYRIVSIIFLGGASVCFGVFLWVLATGLDGWLAINSIMRIPFELTKLGNLFPIPPDFYFRPNDVYYGTFGYHLGFIMNFCLWGLGFFVAFIRAFTVFFQKKLSIQFGDAILTISLFIQLYLYISVYPFKHSQYLIPIAVFVCFYATDAIGVLWQGMKSHRSTQIGFVLVCGVIVYTCYQGFLTVTVPKFSFSNTKTLHELTEFFRVVPRDTYVLDLTGLTMEYPSPYYVMHLPFGQFAQFLSAPLPPLIPTLETLDVPIIYAGKRFNTLSIEDQAYIQNEYKSVGDGSIFVRTDDLSRFDFSSL